MQELSLLQCVARSEEAQALVTYQLGTLQYAAGLAGAEGTCRTSLELSRQLESPDPEQVRKQAIVWLLRLLIPCWLTAWLLAGASAHAQTCHDAVGSGAAR